jgi:hypothetical protein
VRPNSTDFCSTRSGAGFAKALETATAAQVKAAASSASGIKEKIQQEFAKQNLPTIASCLKEIEDKAERSLKIAERIHDHADQYEQYAKDRLATSEKLCKESLDNIETLNWCGAWVTSILCSIAVTVVAGFVMYGLLRSHSEKILANKIALASAAIQENRDAFVELAVAGVSLRVHRTGDPQTGGIVPSEFAILVEHAEAAEMRDYGNGRAGFIFVKGPTPEQEMHHLEIRVENTLNEIRTIKK